jgi:hypothetical protein
MGAVMKIRELYRRAVDRLADGNRDGFALAAALLAMVVVGAIVTGGFFAASQEGQIGNSTRRSDEALMIAEAGMNNVLGMKNKVYYDTLAFNTTIVAANNVKLAVGNDTLGTYTVNVRRLTDKVYVVTSTGTATRGGLGSGATRTLGQIVRTLNVQFNNRSAVYSYSSVRVGGSAIISGYDTFPPAWNGCDTTAPKAGIVTRDTVGSRETGHGDVYGSPAEVMDTTIQAANFQQFGDITYTQLKQMANVVIPASSTVTGIGPVSVGGICITANPLNWGEPIIATDPCYTYWPVIWAQGDLHLSSSGTGQGILLVDGNLDVTGGFTFYGVTVVQGTVSSTGTGGHLNGTVMVYDGGILSDQTSTSGNSLVQFSSCSIQRAVNNLPGISRAFPVINRSWFDLSAVGAS